MTPHDRRRWYEPYYRLLKVLIELSAHLLALIAILLGIKLIELLVKALWGQGYLFFERVNLRFLFDLFDVAILGLFLIWGVYLVGAAYVRKPRLL